MSTQPIFTRERGAGRGDPPREHNKTRGNSLDLEDSCHVLSRELTTFKHRVMLRSDPSGVHHVLASDPLYTGKEAESPTHCL
jgi:hypothetical protein